MPMTPETPLAVRYQAAKDAWEQAELLRQAGRPAVACAEDELRVAASRRLAEAASDAGVVPRGEGMREHLARMQTLLDETKVLAQGARRSDYDVAVMRFHVADARMLVAAAERSSLSWIP